MNKKLRKIVDKTIATAVEVAEAEFKRPLTSSERGCLMIGIQTMAVVVRIGLEESKVPT